MSDRLGTLSKIKPAPVQREEVVPTKRTKQKAASPEIDPTFQPVVDAFAGYRDLAQGKLMSSYGLKVNGKIFAMFGTKQFVTKLPQQTRRRAGEWRRWQALRSRSGQSHEKVCRGPGKGRLGGAGQGGLRFRETRQMVS